jgi:hypothetical protein
MMTTTYVRGQAIDFIANFTDINGQPAIPSSATLAIVCFINGVKTTITAALASSTNGWEYTWDSTPADPGVIEWFARTNGPPYSAVQDQFILQANSANPNL